jgi:hypothetical protein
MSLETAIGVGSIVYLKSGDTPRLVTHMEDRAMRTLTEREDSQLIFEDLPMEYCETALQRHLRERALIEEYQNLNKVSGPRMVRGSDIN